MLPLPSTPRKNTYNSSSKYAAVKAPRNEVLDNMDSEMRKNFVGPMPVKEFFEAFLPVEPPEEFLKQPQEFVEMANATSEKDLYTKFVSFNFLCYSFAYLMTQAGYGRKFDLHIYRSIRQIRKAFLRRRRESGARHRFLRHDRKRSRIPHQRNLLPADGDVC